MKALARIHAEPRGLEDGCESKATSHRSTEIPAPTEPFFFVLVEKPAPPLSMWDEERESPWLLHLYRLALIASIFCSMLLDRCSA